MCVLAATLAGPKLEKAPLQADLQADVTCNGSDSAIVIGEFTRGYFFAFFFLSYNSRQIEGVATCAT